MPARGEVESDESLRIFDESWQPNHIPPSIVSFARYAQGIFFASQTRLPPKQVCVCFCV